MLLRLPTFNATLNPCPVSPATFTAHANGKFCGSCQREVQDFSQSANPVADLAAARAAAPDGRVCGSFQREQVQAPPLPTLTRRLKWFFMALVLVVGQGLTAREALAQVRRPTVDYLQQASKSNYERVAATKRDSAALADENPEPFFGVVVEAMPTFRGGSMAEATRDIQKRVVWPLKNGKIILAEGRIFVNFTVGKDGLVHDVKILKSFNPLFNATVLRAVQTTQGFKPAKQNGRPVETNLTVPISFKLK